MSVVLEARDITKVYGNPSDEFTEAAASNAAPSGTAQRALAQTDFVGIAIHCGVGGGICAATNTRAPISYPMSRAVTTGFSDSLARSISIPC